MNFSTSNLFRSLLLASVVVTIAAAPALAVEPCDPLVVDGSGLESARSSIDAACPCGQYDGSEGNGRADFKRCVGEQIGLALENELVRKPCKGPLKRMYAASVCGRGDDELAPCVEQSAAGKVSCRIRTATKCQERSGDVCVNGSTCVDSADTTGDMVVDADDSGLCIALPPTTTSTTSTTSTTTSTTSTTSTTMLELCGEGSPDAVIDVNLDTDFHETVSESDSCPNQNPSAGGCSLISSLDGSVDFINTFHANRSTDERVCSQDDAALSYRWEIIFPPALLGSSYQIPWITGWNSPVLVIPPSSLPSLEDTDTGSDTYWRVRLTVTPLPLPGEEFTPAPTLLYFRFKYIQTEMSLECSSAVGGSSCNEACLAGECSAMWCDAHCPR